MDVARLLLPRLRERPVFSSSFALSFPLRGAMVSGSSSSSGSRGLGGGGGGGGVLPPRGSSRGGVVGVRGIIFSHPHPASPMDHSLEGLADLELKVCDLELDVCTGVAHQG